VMEGGRSLDAWLFGQRNISAHAFSR